MRDIRGDLQERASSAEEDIRACHADCEKAIEQLQKERDAKVARVTMRLEMLSKLIEFENESMTKALPPEAPSRVVPLPSGGVAPTPLAKAIGFRKVS